MSDDEYLHFVNKHLLMPLRKLRRRDRPTRYRKSPFASKKSYWPTLRPRCDAGDSHHTVGVVRTAAEADGQIAQQDTIITSDDKKRKRPKKKTPQQKIADCAKASSKASAKEKQHEAEAGIGPHSEGEMARKLVRLEELESENQRLRRENISLTSEVGELQEETPFATSSASKLAVTT
jgi:hypothetical protein